MDQVQNLPTPTGAEPETFIDAVPYFKNPDNCLNYLAKRRWPNGVSCPTCGRTDVTFVPSRRLWQCKTRHPKAQFSIKTGTILEDSPLGLDKWLPVIWKIGSCKNGVSSWEIHRDIGVTQKTAWFMLHRVRLGMQNTGAHGGKLGGPGREIEADESFIGGKVRNMHADRKRRSQQSSQKGDKSIVMGILERGGVIRTKVLENRKRHAVESNLRENVEPGSNLYTDALQSYAFIDDEFTHQVIDHAVSYVEGAVHTNGLENFWSCLKRTIGGTYVSVEPFHLFRYLDEQAFRYNNRKPMNDAQRFSYLCRKIVGKRLTYDELTGKVGEKQEAF